MMFKNSELQEIINLGIPTEIKWSKLHYFIKDNQIDSESIVQAIIHMALSNPWKWTTFPLWTIDHIEKAPDATIFTKIDGILNKVGVSVKAGQASLVYTRC